MQQIEDDIRNMWQNRTKLMPQPTFTDEDIERLPNIIQAINIIRQGEMQIMVRDNGWQKYDMMKNIVETGMRLHSFKSIISPDRIYINDAEDDTFIINRLASGRYCLKPNLRGHRFIFRGQKKHYPLIQSSFARQNAEWQRILSNVRCEEFTMLLRTHPLFMLLERGIHIETIKKPVFLEMNYYGLSQHYNFNTGLVDFTSDLLTSAFFAVTTNHGDDKYEPYGGTDDNRVGVIYIHEINPFATFTAFGFGTIGQQIYPRTGAQKGFCYQEGRTRMPLENIVFPMFFRHDIKCAEEIFQQMKGGRKLFPEDDLSPIAQEILHSQSVTGEAFSYNTYVNQADIKKNEALLTDNGIKVDWHKRRCFTPDMLHQYYENINNGWWEEFCNNISFVDEDEEEMKESLLNIPKNPHYKQYFDSRQLELLHYYTYGSMERAKRNAKKEN